MRIAMHDDERVLSPNYNGRDRDGWVKVLPQSLVIDRIKSTRGAEVISGSTLSRF